MLAKEKVPDVRGLIKKSYSTGHLAVFYRESDGEPFAELSIDNNSVELSPNEFILKNYSENFVLAQELLNSKVFILTDRYILIGANLCPICRVSI